jgi:hypothetical protein
MLSDVLSWADKQLTITSYTNVSVPLCRFYCLDDEVFGSPSGTCIRSMGPDPQTSFRGILKYQQDSIKHRPAATYANVISLDRFQWLEDEEIGSLPETWNWLVGHNRRPEDGKPPKAIHYTCGGPWFPQYVDCDYAQLWLDAEKVSRYRE